MSSADLLGSPHEEGALGDAEKDAVPDGHLGSRWEEEEGQEEEEEQEEQEKQNELEEQEEQEEQV